MSLDVHLSEVTTHTCAHCGHVSEVESDQEVYWANITHNLNRMADEAGIYDCCWQPADHGITKAEQMISPLEAGIALMKSDRPRFEKFNAKNGWGTYDRFLPWLERYLEACRANPNAIVRASR